MIFNMNELTRNLKKIMVPKAALIAYQEENKGNSIR